METKEEYKERMIEKIDRWRYLQDEVLNEDSLCHKNFMAGWNASLREVLNELEDN